MPRPAAIDEEPEPARTSGRKRPGLIAILGGLFVAALAMLAGLWMYTSNRADEALAMQVARLRSRHEPLTTVELNDYYQPAANRPDMTGEILAALANCDAADLKPLAAGLPIVGQGTEVPPAPQPWPQLEEVEAYLARQSAALDTFRSVARRDGTARFPVDFTAGIATLVPHAQSMRQAARVLSLQFHVHVHRNRPREAVDSLLDQIALARTLEQEPIVVSQLVRLAVLATAVGHTQQLVRQADVAEEDLARLQQALRQIDSQPCLQRALAGEHAISYMACIDPHLADGSLTLTPAGARMLAQQHPRRVADATTMLDMNLRIGEAADQSLYAALQESRRSEQEVRKLSNGTWSRFSHSFTILLSPAYLQAVTAFNRSAARRDCADAALAAELYRRRHGHWPETLDQLVPEFLPSVPIDPFDDQPLKLVSTPTEFKVYSVGKDGKDDHGNISDREDPNTDIGFILPVKGTNPP